MKGITVEITANSKTAQLALKEGSDISDAIAMLDIPPDEVGITAVNGKAVPRETKLRDGDRIKIYPVIVDG